MKKAMLTILLAGTALTLGGLDAASGHIVPTVPQNSRPGNVRPARPSQHNHLAGRGRPSSYGHRHHHGNHSYHRGYYGFPYYSSYYAPSYYGYHGYGYPGVGVSYTTYADPHAPGYAASGAILGGVIGGIIGNNSGHRNTWAGVALGSTIGLLAGSAADNAAVRRQRAERDAAQTAANNAEIHAHGNVARPGTPAPQQPRRVNTIKHASVTPMSQANALFNR